MKELLKNSGDNDAIDALNKLETNARNIASKFHKTHCDKIDKMISDDYRPFVSVLSDEIKYYDVSSFINTPFRKSILELYLTSLMSNSIVRCFTFSSTAYTSNINTDVLAEHGYTPESITSDILDELVKTGAIQREETVMLYTHYAGGYLMTSFDIRTREVLTNTDSNNADDSFNVSLLKDTLEKSYAIKAFNKKWAPMSVI